MPETIHARFWGSVDKNGPYPQHVPELNNCWVWTASKTQKINGYGVINFRGKRWTSSRVSWILHNGEIPPGMCVLHKCDNPACVNPDHLFVGTYLDNVKDMMRKGRHKMGGGNRLGRYRLTKEIDPLIPKAVFPALFYCYRKNEKKTLSEFAAELKISTPTLWRLEHGKQIDGTSMGKLIFWLFSN